MRGHWRKRCHAVDADTAVVGFGRRVGGGGRVELGSLVKCSVCIYELVFFFFSFFLFVSHVRSK